MIHIDILDLPVYRISSFQYDKDLKRHLKVHPLFQPEMDDFYSRNPDRKLVNIDHVTKNYGGAWIFNEIIGYIRLHILGSQIRGEWFCNDCKRHVRTRRKQFVYQAHKLAPEMDFLWPLDNMQMYQTILNYIESCKSELPKKFYIDISNFTNLGRYVDWISLISQNRLSSK